MAVKTTTPSKAKLTKQAQDVVAEAEEAQIGGVEYEIVTDDNPLSVDDMIAALCAPFPQAEIKTRKGGGNKDLRYVSGGSVIRRLIQATRNTYSTRVVEKEFLTIDGKPAMLVCVELEIPRLGSRQGYGVHVFRSNGGEDLYKAAFTDGLKKAATQFGVALELYFDEEEQEAPPPPTPPTLPAALDGELKDLLRKRGVDTFGKLNTAIAEKFGLGVELTNEMAAEWKAELRGDRPKVDF